MASAFSNADSALVFRAIICTINLLRTYLILKVFIYILQDQKYVGKHIQISERNFSSNNRSGFSGERKGKFRIFFFNFWCIDSEWNVLFHFSLLYWSQQETEACKYYFILQYKSKIHHPVSFALTFRAWSKVETLPS